MQDHVPDCAFSNTHESREHLSKGLRCRRETSHFFGSNSDSKLATPPKDKKLCEMSVPMASLENEPQFSLLGACHGVGSFVSRQAKRTSRSRPKQGTVTSPRKELLMSDGFEKSSSAGNSRNSSPIHRLFGVLRVLYLLMPLVLCALWLLLHFLQCLPSPTQNVALLLFPNLRPWVLPSVAASPWSEPLNFKVEAYQASSSGARSGLWGWLKSALQSAPSHVAQNQAVPRRFPSGSFSANSGDGDDEAEGRTLPSLPPLSDLRTEFSRFQPGFVDAPEALKAHSGTFKKEVLEVVDGIFVALGYGLANCVILEGPLGLVVVDTMESPEAMAEVWSDFSKLWLDKQKRRRDKDAALKEEEKPKTTLPPVLGIIYTHFHSDHTFGASVVYVEGVTEVHAHWLTRRELEKVVAVTSGSTYRRGMRQFGVYVHEKDMVNAGIGPKLRYRMGVPMGTVAPTHVMWGERKKIFLAGLSLELIHAPGESKDQTVVWLEDSRVLLAADNVYKALPNIYAIRGTETRSCLEWIQSLDMMRELKPKVMILGHTRPVIGEEEISDLLQNYRDAIKFIHDQTVRLMNKGLTVEAIAQLVVLPDHLRQHPYLQPLYGALPWAVRAVFNHYMGWFGGRAEELNPLSQREKALMFERLAGDSNRLLQHSLQFLREDKFQWALEVASAVLALRPKDNTARWLTAASLRALASTQTAASGRNWYLTAAQETEGSLVLSLGDEQKRQALRSMSSSQIISLLPYRIIDSAAADLDAVILFRFEGEEEAQQKIQKQHRRQERTLQLFQQEELRQQMELRKQGGGAPPIEVSESASTTRLKSEVSEAAPDASPSAERIVDAPLASSKLSAGPTVEEHCVHFRLGVVSVHRKCDRKPDVEIQTNREVFLSILTKDTHPLMAAVKGQLKVKGSTSTLLKALASIELDDA